MDRVWAAEILAAVRDKHGLAVDTGLAHGRPLDWREDVKAASRAGGASRAEAEDVVRQFEEKRRTLKERAAALLAASRRGKKAGGNGKGEG